MYKDTELIINSEVISTLERLEKESKELMDPAIDNNLNELFNIWIEIYQNEDEVNINTTNTTEKLFSINALSLFIKNLRQQ